MAARCISVTFNAADCDQIGLSNPPAPEIAAAKRLSAPCSSLPTTVLHAHSVLHDARILSRSSLIIMHCNHSKWGREGLGTAGGGTLTHFTLCLKTTQFLSDPGIPGVRSMGPSVSK